MKILSYMREINRNSTYDKNSSLVWRAQCQTSTTSRHVKASIRQNSLLRIRLYIETITSPSVEIYFGKGREGDERNIFFSCVTLPYGRMEMQSLFLPISFLIWFFTWQRDAQALTGIFLSRCEVSALRDGLNPHN